MGKRNLQLLLLLLTALLLLLPAAVHHGQEDAQAVATGLSPAQTMALSLLTFTGASQFALVGVLGAVAGPEEPPGNSRSDWV